jgi:hypothetical protein
VALVALVALVA